MILEIKRWCEGIIIAVVLCIIIEILIPKGNNNKYIKVVIGIYIMYVILNPILELLNYEMDFKNIFTKFEDYEEVSNSFDDNIKDVYIFGIENNIKQDIKSLGYSVDNVKVFVDNKYENIEKIEIIKLLTDGNSINKENLVEDYTEVIEYLEKNYKIGKSKIEFK